MCCEKSAFEMGKGGNRVAASPERRDLTALRLVDQSRVLDCAVFC